MSEQERFRGVRPVIGARHMDRGREAGIGFDTVLVVMHASGIVCSHYFPYLEEAKRE